MRALLLSLALAACCGASLETQVRSALNTFAQVVDPAYEAAMATCVANEADVMTLAREGEITPADARARLESIMGPCLRVGAAFDQIRKTLVRRSRVAHVARAVR